MSEFISTLKGGVDLVTLLGAAGVGICALLLRPKAFLAVLVALSAPFPGSRLYKRYRDALALVHGVSTQAPTDGEPACQEVTQVVSEP